MPGKRPVGETSGQPWGQHRLDTAVDNQTGPPEDSSRRGEVLEVTFYLQHFNIDYEVKSDIYDCLLTVMIIVYSYNDCCNFTFNCDCNYNEII